MMIAVVVKRVSRKAKEPSLMMIILMTITTTAAAAVDIDIDATKQNVDLWASYSGHTSLIDFA
jgi:hypothetical protein